MAEQNTAENKQIQPWYWTGSNWYTYGIDAGLKYPIPYWLIILFVLTVWYMLRPNFGSSDNSVTNAVVKIKIPAIPAMEVPVTGTAIVTK